LSAALALTILAFIGYVVFTENKVIKLPSLENFVALMLL